MTDKKTFLVSDLANELGVPRTTINDWLKRFDRYLTTEMTGKRRVYTLESFEVLKVVNAMRNEGRSATEIEAALAGKFAICAEEVAPAESEKEKPQSAAAVEEKAPAVSGEAALPALRREEFDRFIGTMENLSNIENSRKRSAVYVWCFIILLAIFSVVTAWYLAQLLKMQNANALKLNKMMIESSLDREAAQKRQQESEAVMNAQKKQISDLRSDLAASRKREEAASAEAKRQLEDATKNILKVTSDSDARQRRQSEELKAGFDRDLKMRDAAAKVQEVKLKAAEKNLILKEQELDKAKSEADSLRRELDRLKKEKAAPVNPAGAAVPV
ncbi:MAG: MerR family transcriptional regulator, partial [Lentisphaeria bacterium]|nr:MerR family transcriptional regulator [Lentisphaeria bacterium]